jgi:hypothetical protein
MTESMETNAEADEDDSEPETDAAVVDMPDDGTFWMAWQDVVAEFDEVLGAV